MKLYGAKITQQYIQLSSRKKRPRYPRSIEYPYEAWAQEKYKTSDWTVSRTAYYK